MKNSRRIRRRVSKPYAVAGSGPLSSLIWKDGCEASGWRYRFNLFRIGSRGRIDQMLTPTDLKRVVSLARVLALMLLDDGCLPEGTRAELTQLVVTLDEAASIVESDL